jgi:hypothetical protein
LGPSGGGATRASGFSFDDKGHHHVDLELGDLVARVTEISATSTSSFEDAIRQRRS